MRIIFRMDFIYILVGSEWRCLLDEADLSKHCFGFGWSHRKWWTSRCSRVLRGQCTVRRCLYHGAGIPPWPTHPDLQIMSMEDFHPIIGKIEKDLVEKLTAHMQPPPSSNPSDKERNSSNAGASVSENSHAPPFSCCDQVASAATPPAQSIYLPIYLSVYLSIYLSIYLSVYLSYIYISLYLFISLSLYLSTSI